MKRSVAAVLAAAGLASLTLAPLPLAAQEVTLRLHQFLPPVANPVKNFMVPWALSLWLPYWLGS
jgi:TRAP-type transport system periplasmic protein